MKRLYSYYLIKPDGIRFIDEICSTIEKNFSATKYYVVENFEETIKELYHKHYTERGENFANSYESYLYGVKELFGNQSIIALVADKSDSYETFVKRIHQIKIELRKTYSNDNIGVITNYGTGKKNYVRFISQDGTKSIPRIMENLGNHRINNLNIIHSPDADVKVTLEELNILLASGIIDDKNMITADILNKMRKYKTVTFQNDMKEPDYEGQIQPDISGFTKMEIKRLENVYFEK